MRILYSAIDQVVPGTTGGSVHVRAVAEGLAARGHDVHVLVTLAGDVAPSPVHWIEMHPPFGVKQLRWARIPAVKAIAASLRPDVVIERYYNFGGEGIAAARQVGAVAVLEVNAPIVDHPGSSKALVDRALLVEPMRRWREHLCRSADVLVTPHRAILPPGTPEAKIVQLEWGADTDRFHPGITGPLPYNRPRGTVAVFAGAFRAWHGAIHLARAMRQLRERGRHDVGAVFIGEGPELPEVREAARGVDGVVFAGPVPHDRMPVCLAASDIGVAPFDPGRHPPLAVGFYWSPLKIFEYLAAGLPVVAPAIARIQDLVLHGREGLLYDPGDPGALAAALERLADPTVRAPLGRGARDRAVAEYSWAAHCAALEQAIARVRPPAARG